MADVPSFDDIQDVNAQPQPQQAPPSFDSIEEAPKFDDIEHQEPSDQYSTPGQQIKGAAEAAARGATFGLSTPIEEQLGIASHKDIKGREQALNPAIAIGAEATGAIGSMMVPGVGEGWLLSKAAQTAFPIAKEASTLAKVGRLALRGSLEMMGFATGDELSDALLDKGHDDTAVVSHIVGAGAAGLLTGGLFGTGGQALEKLQNAKLGEYLDNVAIGLGAASKGEEQVAALKAMHEMTDTKLPKGIDHGIKLYNEMSEHIAGKITDAAATGAGALVGKIGGGAGEIMGGKAGLEIAKKWLEPYADKLASKTINSKVATPILLQALKLGEHSGLTNALNYGTKAARGLKLIQNAIEDTLNIGGKEALHATEPENDKLDEYIKNGGINQQIDDLKQDTPTQNFAEGGRVEAKPIQSVGGVASMYPAQHQMLTATKGRISNYLTQLQPQQPPGMMFDTVHRDEAKERTYRNALSVANAPLSVLSHIKNGTITPEHLKHLNSMYPELQDHLSKKITETLTKHQYEEDKRPNYKVRQGLAMFMGAPLDSTMTPMSIQAAQSIYAQKQPQQPAPTKPKKGTATLSKFSKDYQTPEQQRQARATKD